MKLFGRTPWTRQPQQAVGVNKASSLARGLLEYFPLNTPRSMVSAVVGTPTNGATFSPSQLGIAAAFDGTDDYIALPSMTLPTGNTFTVSFLMRMTANPATARQFVFGSDDAASALQIEVGNCNTNNAAAVAIQYSGNFVACTATNLVVQNAWQHWVITKNGTAAGATEFCLNGVKVSTPTTNAAATFADVVSTRRIGQRSAGSPLPFGGSLLNFGFWRRVLSAAEIKSLSDNPWQIFQPLRNSVYFAPAAAGNPALSGQAVVAAQDTLTPVMDAVLSGNASVAGQGTLSATLLLPLAGQATSAEQGNVAPVITVALTGLSTTVDIGTLSVANQDVTVALTGVAASVGQGALLAESATALSGQSADVAQGALLPQVAATLTGQATALAPGAVLPQTGVVLSGQSASVGQGAMVAPGDLTVALTGVGMTVNTGLMVGSVTPDPGNGKSGVNRMWLIEYYTKEFAKKAPVVAVPGGLTAAAKRKAVKKAVAAREAQIEALAAKAESDLEALAQGVADAAAAQQFTYNLIRQATLRHAPETDFLQIAQDYRKRQKQEDDDLMLFAMVL